MCIVDTRPLNPIMPDEHSNTAESNTDWIVHFVSEGGHRSVFPSNDILSVPHDCL